MKKIALLGLGKMGSALATRILEAGMPLVVYNRSPAKMQALVDQGAKAATSIKAAVEHADIIISCLLDDQAIIDTTLGKAGFLRHMKPSAIHLGTATILPETAELLAAAHQQHGSCYVSSAVLGVPKVAYAGKLTTFCSGDQAAIGACQVIFETYAANIINLGTQPKAALIMKIAMNYSLITALEVISELYAFAEKSGLDLEFIQKGLHQIYGHPAFKLYVDKIKTRNFNEVNFDIKGGMKDVKLFQTAFDNVGVRPKIADIVKERYASLLASGVDNKDWSVLYEAVREESGLK